MSNAHYAKGKEKILSAQINFLTDHLKVALVKNTYPQNLATDEFLTVVSSYILGTPQTLTGKSVTSGIFDADDPVFSAVASGDASEGVIIYKDTGTAATSPLLEYIDTIVGFPLTTNGGDIVVQWDNGAYKIFSL